MEDTHALPRLCLGMGGSDVSKHCVQARARPDARICSDERQNWTVFQNTPSHMNMGWFVLWLQMRWTSAAGLLVYIIRVTWFTLNQQQTGQSWVSVVDSRTVLLILKTSTGECFYNAHIFSPWLPVHSQLVPNLFWWETRTVLVITMVELSQ